MFAYLHVNIIVIFTSRTISFFLLPMKWTLLLALMTMSLIGISCQKKEADEEADSSSTSAQADSDHENQDTQNPADQTPDSNLKFLVPVTQSSSAQHIQPGSIYKYKNNVYVAFYLKNATRARYVSVYLPYSNTHTWKRCPIILTDGSNHLASAKLPDDYQGPAREMGKSSTLEPSAQAPQTIKHAYTAEWAEPIEAPDPTQTKDNESLQREEITTELNDRYTSIKQQAQLIQRERYELSRNLRGPRNSRKSEDLSEVRQKIQKLDRERADIIKQLRDVRNEAQTHGVILGPTRMPTASSSRSKNPRKTARIVKLNISAKPTTGSHDYTLSNATPKSPYLATSPQSLAFANNDQLQVTPLNEIGKLHEIQLTKIQAYFTVEAPHRSSLHISVSQKSHTLTQKMKLVLAKKGMLPQADLIESAPHVFELYKKSSTKEFSGSAKLSNLDLTSTNEFEGCIAYRSNDDHVWTVSQPFSFTLTNKEKILIPAWLKHDGVTLEAPQTNSTFKDAPECVSIHQVAIPDTISHACLAGAGRYLVVHHGKQLQILDIHTFKWVAELPWTDEDIAFTADAQYLYTATQSHLKSYQLPSLKLAQEIELHTRQPLLAISTGSHASKAALLAVYSESLHLIDTSDLQPLQQLIQPSTSTPQPEFSQFQWPQITKGYTPKKTIISTSLYGEIHTVKMILKSEKNSTPNQCVLIDEGEHWKHQPNYGGLAGAQRSLIQKTQSIRTKDLKRIKYTIKRSLDQMIPAIGPGVIAINFPRKCTVPAANLTLRYFNHPKVTHATAYIGATAATDPMMRARTDKASASFQRLLYFPEPAHLLSIGDTTITLENLPMKQEEGTSKQPHPHQFLNTPSSAKRGKHWSFLPIVSGVDIKKIKLIDAPENMTLSEKPGLGLTWDVPNNYIDDTATIKISTGSQELEISIDVLGRPVSILTTISSNTSQGLAIDATFPFPEKINRIIPIHSTSQALIVSGNNRKLTLYDFSTNSLGATYQPSTGAVVAAIGSDAIFVWHLNGNLVEKRHLKTLAPLHIASISSVLPLRALIGGDVPLAIFETTQTQLVLNELNPEKLTLSEPIVLPNFRVHHLKNHHHINYLPYSANGKQFTMGNHLIRKMGPQKYTLESLSKSLTSMSNQRPYITPDGTSIISGNKALNLRNNRVWLVNSPNSSSFLIPDISGTQMMSWEKGADRQYLLKIFDFSTKQHILTISGLAERQESHSSSSNSDLETSRLIYDSQTRTLLTLNNDASQLFVRKIPTKSKE